MSRYLLKVPFYLSVWTVVAVIYHLGFEHSINYETYLEWLYAFTLSGAVGVTVYRYLRKQIPDKLSVKAFDIFSVLFFLVIIIHRLDKSDFIGFLDFMDPIGWTYTAIFLAFIREFSALNIDYKRTTLNPAQLFILSFLLLILVGTLLLVLPRSTHTGISVVDALFTSTSAVCVTGLIVVDTGSYFTIFGQSVIVVLIQLGGLGIMTIASYFSYFFRGGSSYENQLMLRDMTNSDKLGEVFYTLKKIILITFGIELIGAVFIFYSLDASMFGNLFERIYFSVFHTVSGFCNAGFSTLPNSLYESGFRFNYPLHLAIAGLYILGGLGFPIAFNVAKYVKYGFRRVITLGRAKAHHQPWILNLNTRIVLVTSIILMVIGTVSFYAFEYNNTLAEHGWFGKIVTAFFGATTPRTAGFNTVDTGALYFHTIMIVFLLMWIGASPASTGGGIKTSTFAIATLNFISLARGKSRIEIFKREIADVSVRRSFALIALSLVVIGGAVFALSISDGEKDLIHIAFESFSAYSTVGLSLGITGDLSQTGKLIIIGVMFVGRVSMLTILIAVFRKVKYKNYRYPTEEILIT
jgi:trk system potassium uptake protein